MRLEVLKPAEGSAKNRKRIGRGQGSGRGSTSTRGHKGAKSRSGYSKGTGFEGGQMPLQRRIPKFGFKNSKKIVSKPINLDDLQKLIDAKKLKEITPKALQQHGLANKRDQIKILGRGEITAAAKVTAHKFSESAKEAIEKAGGSTTVIG